MPRQLVECVPNFSEGRDQRKIDAIVAAITAVPGVVLLDRESDVDHNRCVITFVGPPEAVAEAAFRSVEQAVQRIDLTTQTGAHPRIGAADVVPFIPIEGVTVEDCIKLAEGLGQRLWNQLKVPVYFYEAAAKKPERTNLEYVRRGQFEALRTEMGVNPARDPDCGEPFLHPTAGATAVGVRKFLVAYNINLGTPDVSIATRIAKTIRFSSGGFRYVKSMGVNLAERRLAQVSINMTDFELTPLHLVFETVRREAERYGVPVVGSEVVGLIPRKALEMTAGYFLRIENFKPDLVLENRMADEMAERGGLNEFLDELAAPTAAPGGGSASAAAAAMAASLGAMVCKLSKQDASTYDADRQFFSDAAERDSEAYKQVMAAYKLPKAERAPFVEEAMQRAAEVPLQVVERTCALMSRLEKLEIPARMTPDLSVAKSLLRAAREGALENVRINLESIHDAAFRATVSARLQVCGAG